MNHFHLVLGTQCAHTCCYILHGEWGIRSSVWDVELFRSKLFLLRWKCSFVFVGVFPSSFFPFWNKMAHQNPADAIGSYLSQRLMHVKILDCLIFNYINFSNLKGTFCSRFKPSIMQMFWNHVMGMNLFDSSSYLLSFGFNMDFSSASLLKIRKCLFIFPFLWQGFFLIFLL